jgi:hypothetical protein
MVKSVGFLGFVLAVAVLLAAIGYIAERSIRGFFWSSGKKSGTLIFVKEIFYILLVLPLFLVGLGRLHYYGLILVWYLPVFAVSFWNTYTVGAELHFNLLVSYSKKRSLLTRMVKRVPLLTIWLIMALEIIVTVVINPLLPLLQWFVIVYSVILVILQTPLTEGLILHLHGVQYVRILTTERTAIEGFLTHQNSNTYTILQKDKDLLVQSNYVRTMVPIEYREQKKDEDSPYF